MRQVEIRPAALADTMPIKALCEQLGYPVGDDEIRARLAMTAKDDTVSATSLLFAKPLD